ncbi:MAG: IreB family regulatory phosphoprotein, partial [Clostridia bacterium]|nr:IreB family regulatory phosphoprotein [Clostridia bacterium]
MDDMTDINETVKYTRPTENAQVKDILVQVYTALEEKGYDPVNQIVG